MRVPTLLHGFATGGLVTGAAVNTILGQWLLVLYFAPVAALMVINGVQNIARGEA